MRPVLEHLVALEMLERERKSGRKAKWLYRKADKLGEKVTIVDGDINRCKQRNTSPAQIYILKSKKL